MRTLILILLCSTCHAQKPCASLAGRLDTVPHQFIDGQRAYNYYNKNGSLAWGGVKEFNPALGHSYTIIATKPVIKQGYIVYTTDSACYMKRVQYLDANKKVIKPRSPSYDATIIL